MKAKNTLLLSAFCLLLGASGCQKCHVCIAKDQDGVARYEYPEMCGSKKDLSAYASKCETEYGKYDFKCECGEPL